MAKVLIIEDDEVIAQGMARHLEAAGFDALSVSNGESGPARPRYGRSHLSLPDLIIPGRPKEAPRGQAEFERTPPEYLSEGLLARLAEQGKKLAKDHAATLAAIEQRFGVPPQVILAIWGRETNFGNFKLPHNAIEVLATQAYLGRRKDMFRQEFLLALKILQEQHVAHSAMKASWAGAMGLTQFMPSEYFIHTHDLDGDGRVDIFRSVPDALASAARQLKGKGWVAGQPWGYEVRVPATADCSLEGPTQARPLADWAKLGFTRAGSRAWSPKELAQQAYLMKFVPAA